MLLLLQLIGLSGLAFGQFYGGHPMMAASPPLGLSPYHSGSGDTETLPISQAELAQLMAQSLASSPPNYGRPRYNQQKESVSPNDDFSDNYDAGEEGAGETPHQPEEFGNNEDGYEHQDQQDNNEGSPYQQQGHSEGAQEEAHYQQPQHKEPQQNGGYESAAPNYRPEQEAEQYQSGQYPDPQSNSYGSANNEDGNQESQSGSYDDQRDGQYYPSSQGQSYGPQSESNRYDGASADPQGPRYHSSYSAPGSGYSGPGSESFMSYDVRNSPKNHFRN